MQRLRMSWFWGLLMLVAGAAYGGDTVHKSVTPDGRVVYSQTPPADGKLDKKMTFEQLPATPLPDHVLAFRAEMERNIAQKAAQANAPAPGHLRLFSARWCGYCRQAQAWLAQNGVPYQNLDIDTPEGMTQFVLTGKKGSIPLLLGANVELRGFSASAYRGALAKPNR